MNFSIIPCTAPFVGAIIGGAIYDILIFTGDSPFNRKRFGLDEWRWRKTMLDPVAEFSEAMPDAIMQTRTRNDEISEDSTSQTSRDLSGASESHSTTKTSAIRSGPQHEENASSIHRQSSRDGVAFRR